MLQQITKSQASQWDENDFKLISLSSWMKRKEIIACDFHTMASIGDYRNLQKSLERDKAKVSIKNKESWTPLMYACYNGSGKTVELLINSGALKDTRNSDSKTAVMIAACHGNCEAIRFFPEKIHIDAEDARGWTALFYAVDGTHHSAANILIQNGSNINKVDKYGGYTATMTAAIGGKNSMLKLLLRNGADPTIKSLEGHTSKSLAISNGHGKLVHIIESYLPKAVKQLNLSNILKLYDMDKYCSIFYEKNIDLGVFLTLTEEDLKNFGVKLFGPRRKMFLLIKHWNSCHTCQNIVQLYYASPSECEIGYIAKRLSSANQEVENSKAFSSPTLGSSLFPCGGKKDD